MGIRSKLNACVLAVSMLGVPFAAHAAGFGKMSVLSNLGQPLRAEIDLVSVQPEEVPALRVQLAAPDAFQERGVDYNSYLRSFRFEVARRDSGQYYIRVTSSQSIGEPFIDFLVEMTWSGGRIVRQYTDVLDPAGYNPVAPTKALVVTAPQSDVSTSPRQQRTAPAAQPLAADEKPAVKSAVRQKRASKQVPEKVTAPVAAKAEPLTQTAVAEKSDGASHTVRKGDTLQKVASEFKPEGVSLDQMLLGIYKKNSDAFVKQNINRLKAGVVLEIPSKGDVTSVTPAEASKEVRAHVTDWNAYKQGLATHVAKAPETKSTTKSTGTTSGKLVAKTEDKATPVVKGPHDLVKLSKGETSDNAAIAAKQRIKSLEEDAAAKEKALKEANERVAKLEKNISDMQHLLELKSKAAADLQKQAEAKAKADKAAVAAGTLKPAVTAAKVEPVKPVVPAKVEPAKPVVVEPVKPKPVIASAPKVVVASSPKAEVAKTASSVQATASTVVKSEVKDASPVTSASAVMPTVEPKTQVETAPIEIAPEEEESTLNTTMIGGGVLGLGLLGALFYFMRRRRARPTFEDSVLTGGDLKSNTVLGSVGASIVDTSSTTDNSFFTDFSREGLGSIDTDDVDPVAEAEVYMAYGRDAQAEEILKDALIKDGGRQEVRLKLMEIYASRKNVANFELYATELHGATHGEGPLWDKAANMGREIDPANALYKLPTATAGEIPSADDLPKLVSSEISESQDAEVDLDFEVGTVKMQAMNFDTPVVDAIPDDGPAMDFDLGLPEEATSPEPAFNLNPDLDVSESETDAMNQTGVHDSPILDFQFDLGELPPVPAMPAFEPDVKAEAVAPEVKDSADLEIVTPAVVEEEVDLDFGFGDINLDLDAPETELPMPGSVSPEQVEIQSLSSTSDELSSGAGGLNFDLEDIDATALDTMEDPIETKLDLAKAYIEMGDIEGAREILNETISEGNDEQRQRAETILEQL